MKEDDPVDRAGQVWMGPNGTVTLLIRVRDLQRQKYLSLRLERGETDTFYAYGIDTDLKWTRLS